MKTDFQKLEVVHLPIASLKPATYNPRKWPKHSIEHLTESISRFGLVDPIIVNGAESRRNIVIGGHFRLHIAKKLKFKNVPVVYLNIPDKEKEKELNLRLNRNTGEWDFDLLKEFNLEQLLDVGFDDSDLQEIWGDILETEDDQFDKEEELKTFDDLNIQLGNMFQLGDHTLICGDSTKLETLQKLVNDKPVQFLTADPPYNISLSYNDGVGAKGKYGGTKVKDNKSKSDYKDFLKEALQNAKIVMQDSSHYFCWSDEKYIGLVQEIYEELDIQNKRVCMWIKNNSMATPQVAFNKVMEPCIYGTSGEPYLSKYHTNFSEVINKNLDTGNRLPDDILDLFSIWLERRLPATEYEHPTQKPPTLYEKAIRRCTKPGDYVLELFGGSGSTLIACEQLKRKCLIVEIDPVFCSLIIRRYENLTGQSAKKIN